ncbi:MAG: FecR domain-containing protein [Betaproteobacteria bacterium]|nr:FecR domain-containing protein [Betaproteobacteria bacterium]
MLTLVTGYGVAIAAQPAGEVIHAQGITSAQQPGESPRFVAKGDPLHEGDIVSTGERGFAVIGLRDGSKMTLRPNTTFVIDKFSHGAGEESALLRLVKGGVRALTGLIGKRNPQGMRVSTATATIGIRGTGFDARICGNECAEEIRSAQKDTGIAGALIVARVAVVSGTASIVGQDGQVRAVTKGAPLLSGETVRTDKGSYAVLAFRDRSKVTVVAESEFKLENVRFSGAQADSGNFVVRVVKGGARVLTGLLAKREPKSVQLNMITAIVGIRGTGFDNRLALDCVAGACSEAAFAYTWEGAIAIIVGQRELLVPLDRAGVFNPARDRLVLLDRVPQFFLDETAPRPDKVEVDFDNLFGAVSVEAYRPGVYVTMRDGHVDFAGRAGSIDLGPGESGYLADGQGIPVRLTQTPPFITSDPSPIPETFDEQSIRLLDVLNPGGGPGSLICEI